MSSADDHFENGPIPAVRVRSELDRIVNSEPFEHSPQLQRFLRFVVEETLFGRGGRLKEYVIGTEVFGRPADYDPQLDSLVRVEAHRLRGAREQYYRQAVSGDGIRIELKKGSYVPSFCERTESQERRLERITPKKVHYRWWLPIAGAVLIAAVVISGWLYLQHRSTQQLLSVDARIAILPFDNLSPRCDDEVFWSRLPICYQRFGRSWLLHRV